jgi:hypothetical protein
MDDEEDLYFQNFDVESPGGRLAVKTGSAPADADAAIDSLVPPDISVRVRPARARQKYRNQADKLTRFGKAMLHLAQAEGRAPPDPDGHGHSARGRIQDHGRPVAVAEQARWPGGARPRARAVLRRERGRLPGAPDRVAGRRPRGGLGGSPSAQEPDCLPAPRPPGGALARGRRRRATGCRRALSDQQDRGDARLRPVPGDRPCTARHSAR